MTITPTAVRAYQLQPDAAGRSALDRSQETLVKAGEEDDPENLRAKFQEFVAGNFFRMWLAEMRKSVKPGPLMHGGNAEKIFSAHLDQTLVERLAQSDGDGLAGRMFQQFVQIHHLQQPDQALEGRPGNDDRPGGTVSFGSAGEPGPTP